MTQCPQCTKAIKHVPHCLNTEDKHKFNCSARSEPKSFFSYNQSSPRKEIKSLENGSIKTLTYYKTSFPPAVNCMDSYSTADYKRCVQWLILKSLFALFQSRENHDVSVTFIRIKKSHSKTKTLGLMFRIFLNYFIQFLKRKTSFSCSSSAISKDTQNTNNTAFKMSIYTYMIVRNKQMTLELIHSIKAELAVEAPLVENSLFILKQFSGLEEILHS